jgi:hypothetical protein
LYLEIVKAEVENINFSFYLTVKSVFQKQRGKDCVNAEYTFAAQPALP